MDEPNESQSKQALSGLFWQNDMNQTFLCYPGAVEDPAWYEPYVYQTGYGPGCTSYPGGPYFCGYAYIQAQVLSMSYGIVDYQGNQYCDAVVHNDWYHYYD